jgi:hypothetical protein
MTMPLATSQLQNIRATVRRITGRTSPSTILDSQIDNYINTFYVYDLPEHLKLETLRINYQFLTSANQAIYDFPMEYYLNNMPPVYIAGYQSYMTQSRENFYRVNSTFQYQQNSVAIGNGSTGPYSGILPTTYVLQGYKPNPPGAYAVPPAGLDVLPKNIVWGITFSGKAQASATSGIAQSISLIDDGQGNLFDINDLDSNPTAAAPDVINPHIGARGSINYLTGAFQIFGPTNAFGQVTGFKTPIDVGQPINAQYVAYKASRPQSVLYFNNQFFVFPIPDQAYVVSFEAFQYPTAFISTNPTSTPLLSEWWQLLAYGAALKIFSDNADFENYMKFRPLFEEHMRLVQRRTINQYSSERTSSIYTEQTQFAQFPFGNMFGGI